MKRSSCLICVGLLFCCVASSYAGVGHPRLFYVPDKIGRLKSGVKTDEVLKKGWGDQLESANRLLDSTLVSKEYAEGGQGQHGNYGRPSSQIQQMGAVLGFAYRMTGDKRYAEKLKEALLHYGTFERWAGDAKHDPPWHSELNTARFCYGYAVGYDSIYDYLSGSEREAIARAMINLGILPTLDDWVLGGKRIHALDSMGHNWWSVCVAMAGLASLSLIDDVPQAQGWVQKVSDSFDEWFYYSGNVLQNKCTNFDRDGAFYESVNYANYALSEYLLFRLAYQNSFPEKPVPPIPLLETCGDFFIHTCYPVADGALSVNFGDSSIKGGGAGTMRMLLANGFEKGMYRWYLDKIDPGIRDPLDLLNYRGDAVVSAPEDLGEGKLYSDIGWAMLRSSWQDDATMLAVKSGYAWNHAHPDAGSFILFHGGKPLIIDSGNCSYSRSEYGSYYRQSRAHNVILSDGQAEPGESVGRGSVTEGKVCRLIDGSGIKYVFADATGPTSWKFSRNYRHFVWVGDCILIFDDLRTHEEGRLEWLLHYEDSAEVLADGIHLSNGDSAKAVVRSMYPRHVEVAKKVGLKDHDPDTKVTYLALSPEGKGREAKFITAVLPVVENRKPPRLELLEQAEAVGVRIHDSDTVTDVWLNLRADGRKMHRNSCNTIGGWETDAYLFAVTRRVDAGDDPDSVSRYFVASGSYLRKDGKVVVDSLSKLFTVFTAGESEMEMALQGQPIINASFRAVKKPGVLKLNGERSKVEYDESSRSVVVRRRD